MTLVTQKFTKIKSLSFVQFSWPRVHKNSQKSKASDLSNFHDQIKCFNFHDPGYTKLHKIQTLQFRPIFMTPGARNFTKIRHFNFVLFSWPRVHETSQKSDTSILPDFHDPGYTKIKYFNFLQFSWPRVHETSQKSDTSILPNFHDPGYTKIHKYQIL